MNLALLSGFLTRDPEVMRTKGGVLIAKFPFSINRLETGESDTVRITCFNKAAETARDELQSGSHVLVHCHVRAGNFPEREKTVHTTEFVAHKIELLDIKNYYGAMSLLAAIVADKLCDDPPGISSSADKSRTECWVEHALKTARESESC